MTDSTDESFREVLDQLDDEGMAFALAIVHAVRRGDEKLAVALGRIGGLPRVTNEDRECPIDYNLLSRLSHVCGQDERVAWGRLLCRVIARGDEPKATAIQDLIARRVAA